MAGAQPLFGKTQKFFRFGGRMLPYVVYTFHSSLQKCQTQIVCAVHVVRHATLEMIQKQMKHYFEEKHC